jgi:hypothetical protein
LRVGCDQAESEDWTVSPPLMALRRNSELNPSATSDTKVPNECGYRSGGAHAEVRAGDHDVTGLDPGSGLIL